MAREQSDDELKTMARAKPGEAIDYTVDGTPVWIKYDPDADCFEIGTFHNGRRLGHDQD